MADGVDPIEKQRFAAPPREDQMVDISRRRVLQSGGAAGLFCWAALRQQGADLERAAPEPGASIRVLRWKQFIQAEFDGFSSPPRNSPNRPASRFASTRRTGTTSGRSRRSPPMSAPDPTSSWAPSTTRSNFPTSCST